MKTKTTFTLFIAIIHSQCFWHTSFFGNQLLRRKTKQLFDVTGRFEWMFNQQGEWVNSLLNSQSISKFNIGPLYNTIYTIII